MSVSYWTVLLWCWHWSEGSVCILCKLWSRDRCWFEENVQNCSSYLSALQGFEKRTNCAEKVWKTDKEMNRQKPWSKCTNPHYVFPCYYQKTFTKNNKKFNTMYNSTLCFILYKALLNSMFKKVRYRLKMSWNPYFHVCKICTWMNV